MPLVAHHYAGQGKVFFVGTDSTWGWRQNVGDRFFYKFWGQAIRFVARRDEKEAKKKSWIEARPLRAQPGEVVEIELAAMTAEGVPRQESKLSLRLVSANQDRAIEMNADPSQPRTLHRPFPGRCRRRLSHDVRSGPRRKNDRGSNSSGQFDRRAASSPTSTCRRCGSSAKSSPSISLRRFPEQLKGEVKRIDLHCESSIWDKLVDAGVVGHGLQPRHWLAGGCRD